MRAQALGIALPATSCRQRFARELSRTGPPKSYTLGPSSLSRAILLISLSPLECD
jgi:hypothetical protein